MVGIASVEGTGQRHVLVLHGWALDSAVWYATRSLTDLEQFTYAYLDFPGYGEDRLSSPAMNLDMMAQAALAGADELGWSRFAVLGHSMGGATAIRVGTVAPERVESIVALTPVACEGTPLAAEAYAGFEAGFPAPRPILQPLAPHLSERQLANLVARCHQSMDHNVWSAYLKNWTGASFADALSAYLGPVHLLYGAEDALVTAEYLGTTAAGLPDAELVRIDEAGHYPMLEQSVRTVRLWESALLNA